MLGLGISKSAQGVKSGIVKLLSSLKRRAEYFENKNDSKSEIKVLKDYELLDKATILLTPTATSDARVHSVKTYTGDELVTNGDFSDGSNGWFVTNGNVTDKYNASMTAYQSGIKITPFNKTGTYRVTFDLVVTSGSCKFDAGGGNDEIFSTSGSKTIYVTNTLKFEFNAFNLGWVGSLDNVSVVDVSSDFDFDRASSATRINSSGLVQDMQSITDPELVLNGDFEELGDNVLLGNNSTFDSSIGDWEIYTNATLAHDTDKLEVTLASGGGAKINTTSLFTGGQQGKILKVRARIWQGTTTRSSIAIYVGSVQETVNISPTPTYFEVYLKPTSNGYLTIYTSSGDGTFFIDNVSVQQVDPNDRWSLSGATTFEDGVLHFESNTNEYSYARQDINSLAANTYKIQLEIKNYVSGACQVGFSGTSPNIVNLNVTSDGTYTANLSPNTNGDDLEISRNFSGGNFNFDVEVVSVKDITFSTDVDLARINYDSNGDNGHILLEPASTNLQDYSENFDEWTHANGDFTITNELAPDGKTRVYKSTVTSSGASAHFYTGPPVLVVGEKYTASYFFKYVDHPWVRITHISSSTTGVWFNLQSGTVGTENGTSVGKIEDYGNGWYRCSNTFTATQTSSTTNVFGAVSEDNGGTNGVGGKSVLVWGAQVENLEYPTSYIPVHSTSNVTRATETLLGSGNSTLINSTEGVLYLDIAMLSESDKDSNSQIFLSTGTSSERVGIFAEQNGDIRAQIRDNDETITSRNVTLLDQSDIGVDTAAFNKIAILYKSGQNKVFVNGSRIISNDFDSFVFNYSLKQLNFDSGNGTGNYFRGKVKAAAVFNEALSDDELELLTGVTNYPSFGALAAAEGYTII